MTLFEPLKVGAHQLQHRVVLAPLTRLRNDELHAPTDLAVEYYSQRATPGGLIISEATAVSANASAYTGFPGIYTDNHIKRWKKVTEAVNEKGAIMYSQLWHAGRAGFSGATENNQLPVGPSAIAIQGTISLAQPLGTVPYETPREATLQDIRNFIDEYVTAARNAIEAGFDGVELHGANGYLIDQFINSSSNKRTDAYGGSIANRVRFAIEVAEAVATAIGAERTAIRFSPWAGLKDCEDETPYKTWSYLLQHLNPNLAYVHFVEPRDDYSNDPTFRKRYSLDPFREVWKDRPFISAGGYTTHPDLIAKVAKETGNLIAVGRAYIANPDLVERLKHGWPLNKYDRSTFYTTGPVGYTDYPYYDGHQQQA